MASSAKIKLLSRTIIRASLCGFLLSILLSPSSLYAQSTLQKENKIKAAYLFNFTKLIEWPEATFANAPEVVICIDNTEEFTAFLRELTQNRTVGRQQRTVKVASLSDASHCHLAYIKHSKNYSTNVIETTVLVGDENTSADKLAIQLFQQNGKIRFAIDMDEVNRLNLAISSELLKLARNK